MTVQGNALFSGSFTSDGNARTLEFGVPISAYMQLNETQFNATPVTPVLKRAWFIEGMANASYMGVVNTTAAATDESIRATADGFTPFRSDDLPTFGTTAITSVTQASPAVVTTAAPHGLASGDIVRMVNVTAMQQISGVLFTATVTGASTFTIPIDTSGFAAAGSGGTVRRYLQNPFAPKERTIVGLTQAASGVVSTSIDHGYAVGDVVSFRFPDNAAYGMTQLNPTAENAYLRAAITAVTASTFTIDVDTTAFTAYATPTSANAFVQGHPVTVPVGAAGTSPNYLGDATDNRGIIGLTLGTAVAGAASDVIRFWAFAGNNPASF